MLPELEFPAREQLLAQLEEFKEAFLLCSGPSELINSADMEEALIRLRLNDANCTHETDCGHVTIDDLKKGSDEFETGMNQLKFSRQMVNPESDAW